MPKFIDITGQRFGRLTVLRLSENRSTIGQFKWVCQCDCGGTIESPGPPLKRGRTISCGCARYERRIAAVTKHGHTRKGNETPEYAIWSDMIQRCHCTTNRAFKNYGGRGIVVCDRWRESFQAFFDDMGSRPDPKLTIEREDNDGPYSPDNCRWATRLEQAKNRRTNHFITHDGQTLHITEWARRIGISGPSILKRLKRGIPLEQVLSKEKLPRTRKTRSL